LARRALDRPPGLYAVDGQRQRIEELLELTLA